MPGAGRVSECDKLLASPARIGAQCSPAHSIKIVTDGGSWVSAIAQDLVPPVNSQVPAECLHCPRDALTEVNGVAFCLCFVPFLSRNFEVTD